MIRKVFKAGNSTVVSLPNDVRRPLGIENGSQVSVKLDRQGGRILIRPVEAPASAPGVGEEFARQVSDFITEYGRALKSLARR